MHNVNTDGPSLIIRATGYSVAVIRPGQTFKIGRDKRNDYVLSDPTVSRFHAAIIWAPDSNFPRFCDSDSTAGSMVDGQKVKYKHLTAAHGIRLGSSLISAEYAHTESQVPTRVDLPLMNAYAKAMQSGKHALLSESMTIIVLPFLKSMGLKMKLGLRTLIKPCISFLFI